MNNLETTTENPTGDLKLYSSKAILGATFFGGPLAAGYMIGENFKALKKSDEGRNALIIGIVSTIALFVGIFMVPESIMENIPRQVIPLTYTAIIWGIVERTQGDILKAHKENGNAFYSGWRAAGISLVSLIIIGIGIFGYAYAELNNPSYEIYDAKIEEFSKNENESLTIYDNYEFKSNAKLLVELDNIVIPKWRRNIELVKELNNLDGLSSDLLEQNKILLTYSELRLESFLLLKKAISEETDIYDPQMNRLNVQIENEIRKLQ